MSKPKRQRSRRPLPSFAAGSYRPALNAKSRTVSRETVRERRGSGNTDTKVDLFNDKQEDRFLHPTKGWRTIRPKRGIAQAIIADIMNGGHVSSARAAKILANI